MPRRGLEKLKSSQRVTIKQVAEKAKVSVTTVSFVLNGNHDQVSEQTIVKVMKVAEELGYIPNRRAQNLQSQKSGFLAMVIDDVVNPYFMKLSQALVDELSTTEYTLAMIDRNNRTVNDKAFWNLFSNATFDGGFIVSKIFDSSNVYKLTNNFMPFVMLDEFVEVDNLPLVTNDNLYGGKLVADYLVAMGHRKIACITGPDDSPNSKLRYLGFKEALEQSDVPLTKEYKGNYHFNSGYEMMSKIVQESPEITAVFCFNDMMAFGAIEACKDNNLSVPDDFSIIGYDNVGQSMGLDRILTTVDQKIDEVAKYAVRMLIDLIQNKEISQKKLLIEPQLIERKTVRKL